MVPVNTPSSASLPSIYTCGFLRLLTLARSYPVDCQKWESFCVILD